ncbi:MAG: universal stress protein [Verrucomicrobiota bacterium]
MSVVICAVDFSDAGKGVVTTAAKEAQLRGAKLWLVHVAAPDPSFVGYDAGPDNERQFRAEHLRKEHEDLRIRAEELNADGIDATAMLIQGPTAEMLVKEADDLQAELIVIGSHGHGIWHRLIAGSTEESVIQQANCPVMVIPVGD